MLSDRTEAFICPTCDTSYPRVENIWLTMLRFIEKWRRQTTVTIFKEEFNRKDIPNVARMFDANPENAAKTISSLAFLWHDGNIVSAVQALESDLGN